MIRKAVQHKILKKLLGLYQTVVCFDLFEIRLLQRYLYSLISGCEVTVV